MSEVQKLESLLSLVQRNRRKPRPVGAAPVARAEPAPAREPRVSSPSPLEVALGGATGKPPAPTPADKPSARAASAPTPAVPTKVAATPAPLPTPPPSSTPVVSTTPTPIAASPVVSPSGPFTMANETAVIRTPKTFGELLTRSLALRPR
jgi:hypothetical protein